MCIFLESEGLLRGFMRIFLESGGLLAGRMCTFLESGGLLAGWMCIFLESGGRLRGRMCIFLESEGAGVNVGEVKFQCVSGVPKIALEGPQTDVLGYIFGGSRGGTHKGGR